MIGRKKKRELEKEENEDESCLHKNKSLLEYQNKCLCSMLDNVKTNLKEKEEENQILNKKIDFLIKFFVKITNNLNVINKMLNCVLEENNIKCEENKNENFIEIVIKNLINNYNNENNENDINKINNNNNENNNLIDEILELKNLKNSFENFTKNLLPLLKNNNFNNNNNENENLEKKISIEIENNNQLKINNDNLKSQNLIFESKITELNSQIETLKSEKFKFFSAY